MIVSLRTNLSVEDFELMSESKGMELVDGDIREKPIGNEASWVATRIIRRLGAFLSEDAGELFDSDAGYRCFPHRQRLVRKPDISYVARGRFPYDRPPRGFANLVPDFVAEVISPNNTVYEVDERLDDFLSVGVPLVWIVNPDRRTVLTYSSEGIRRYTPGQILPGEPVFPGFRVPVEDLFPAPLPPGATTADQE